MKYKRKGTFWGGTHRLYLIHGILKSKDVFIELQFGIRSNGVGLDWYFGEYSWHVCFKLIFIQIAVVV